MLTLQNTSTLGPAKVVEIDGRRVRIRMHDTESWAQLALAFPYRPAVGDTVLAAGQDDRTYIIGVLEGAGTSTFSVPGDLNLEAGGSIRMQARESVVVRAEEVELSAKTLTQRLGRAVSWVKGLFHLRAGSARTRVDGSNHQSAERTYVTSDKETRVDGEQILLG